MAYIQRPYIQRPYKHTVTEVTETGGMRLIVLGTYSTLARAIAAAQKAEVARPDDSREIRLRGWTCRNRHAHGPTKTWVASET